MRLRSSLVWGFAFLWLLSFWPAAHFIASNFKDIADYKFAGILEILLVSAIVPFAASVIVFVLWILKAARVAPSILYGAASLNPLLYCYGAIQSMLVKLWMAAGIPRGVSAFYVILCLSAFLALGRGLRTPRSQQAAVIVAITVLGFNVAKMAYSSAEAFSTPPTARSATADGLQAERSAIHENIYYLLLDSYPGPITTREVFGYENPLPDQLARRGFFSSGDFKTDYFATFLTMSSVLDGNYRVTETSSFPLDKAAFYPINLLGGYKPAAIKALHAVGFKTYFLGNWYARCADKVFVCLDGAKIEQSIAFGTFIDATPAERFFPAVANDPDDAVPPFDKLYDAITPLQRRIKWLASKPSHFFVFAHNMAPHPPTEYNPDCSHASERPTVNLNWSGRKESYLAALKCVNLKVQALLDEIDKYDPRALVVIQSDHGSFTQLSGPIAWNDISPSLLKEMTYPINFIRAPSECGGWLYRGMAQVNTMRFMIGCAMRRRPNYLVDDTYIGRGHRDVDGPYVLLERRPSHEGN